MTNELSAESMAEVLELIYSGQKIAACKRYIEIRKKHFNDNTSLLEAKQFIEKLTEELKAAEPERFANQPKQGCMAIILLCVASVPGALWAVC